MAEPTTVRSIRQTGCRKGFPYYAVGEYTQHTTRDGRRVWRLVRTLTRECRSSRPEFHGVDKDPLYRPGVRHNQPVKNAE